MNSSGESEVSQITRNLKWLSASLYALLVLLLVPRSQLALGWKEFFAILVVLLGALLLLAERPKRILLTILGIKLLVVAGILTTLALQ